MWQRKINPLRGIKDNAILKSIGNIHNANQKIIGSGDVEKNPNAVNGGDRGVESVKSKFSRCVEPSAQCI
jgi:hypothetical protein